MTTTDDQVGPEEVARMQRELRSLRKTCDVLKERLEIGMGQSETLFATFERQANLQRVIEERTKQIRDEAARAQEENRQRERVEALLNDSQRLARVGGWMFDLADESMQCTSEFHRILETDGRAVTKLEEMLPFFESSFRKQVEQALCDAIGQQQPFEFEGRARTAAGNAIWVRVQARVYTEDGRASRILGLLSDVTERKQVESRMAQSQKMESVGQLASGIAHEINTPTQFVSDNVRFLQTAFEDLGTALGTIRQAVTAGDDVDV
jgi:PAS domain S-box-containing protein